jgi:hypothetical protein
MTQEADKVRERQKAWEASWAKVLNLEPEVLNANKAICHIWFNDGFDAGAAFAQSEREAGWVSCAEREPPTGKPGYFSYWVCNDKGVCFEAIWYKRGQTWIWERREGGAGTIKFWRTLPPAPDPAPKS